MSVVAWIRRFNWTKGKMATRSNCHNVAMSGASSTTSGLFPDGAIPKGVTVKVVTLVTGAGGATSFQVGDGTDVDRWGTGIAFAANTKTSSADWTSGVLGNATAAPSEVVLTPNAGTFSGGLVEVTGWYEEYTHP